jgi:hypothetical protein
MIMRTSRMAIAAALGLTALGGQAEASAVIDIYQSGADVVTAASGSVDLNDLTYGGSGSLPWGAFIDPFRADVVLGPDSYFERYSEVAGPGSFGGGGIVYASSTSGNFFAVGLGYLGVPYGYVSGTALSGSSTYEGQTLASLA